MYAETERYSFVCVARDAEGVFFEAISCNRTGRFTPEMAEAMGVREALSWLKKKKLWQCVVVETDSLIRSPYAMLSYFGSVITECKSMLQYLPQVFVLFIRRSANSVAHHLARGSYYSLIVLLGVKISLLTFLM